MALKPGDKVRTTEGRKNDTSNHGQVVQVSGQRVLVRIGGVLKWLRPDRVQKQ